MDQYIRRAGDTWTRLADGTWARWNVDTGIWEPQPGGAPPPPPPPPPLQSPSLGTTVPIQTSRRPSFELAPLRRRGIALVMSMILALAAFGAYSLTKSHDEDSPITTNTEVSSDGGSEIERSLDGTISLAAARVQEQPSVRVTMSMETPLPQGTMTINAHGAFDMPDAKGKLTMSFSGMEQIAPGQSLGDMEAVYDFKNGMVMYMKWPMFAQVLGTDVEWIKMDMQTLSEMSGMDFEALMEIGQDNPMQAVDYLYGVQDVRVFGSERVRGVATTHYSGVIDFEALLEELPADAAASIEELIEMSGITRVPTQIWLGKKDGLPRRVTYGYSSAQGPNGSSTIPMGDMTMEFFDYGAPINVELPNPSEVTDILDLIPQS